MQKYECKYDEISGYTVPSDKGNFYLVSEVDAALAEKDRVIAKTIQFGLEHTDQKNKQIAMLVAENKRLKEEEAAKYKAFWEQSRMARRMEV